MSKLNFSTQAIHSGHNLSDHFRSTAVPIYHTSSYTFKDTDHAAGVFNLSIPDFIYTRLNNPTTAALEERLAVLEGGIGAVATSSGMAAITTAILTLLKAGDHILASSSIYGGTYNLLSVSLPRFGITTTFVDPSDPKNFEGALQDNTRLIIGESIGNPKLDVFDIQAVADVAHAANIPLLIDNTVASPYLVRPIEHGADIVVHSLTKYISGNGTSIAGAIVDGGKFDWASGKFPEFTESAPGYPGLIYAEALGPAAFIAKVRVEGLRDYGASLAPFNAFQCLQGLETLGVRLEKHSQNALELAKWLKQQEEVAWVSYPGLEDSPAYENAKKYLPKGQAGLLTFGLHGGYEAAKQLTNDSKLFAIVANLGDTRSLIIHPASTTHQQLSEEQQYSAGVSPDLIRLSVGLEDVEDLKADLKAVFETLKVEAL